MVLKKYQLLTFYFILLTIIASCDSEPEITVPDDIAAMENVAVFQGDAPPLYDITFEQLASFGDTESVYISSIAGITVAEDGRFFLADRSATVVHVYDGSGNYITAIGGKGEGPGEFLSVSSPKIYNNELYILDTQQQRTSVFDINNYEYLRSHTLSGSGDGFGGFPMFAEPLSNGRFFALYNSLQQEGDAFYQRFVPSIFDTEGNNISSDFITFPKTQMHMLQSDNSIRLTSLEFLGGTHIGITREEEIITGFSDRLLLNVINMEGDTLRSIYHSVNPVPLDRSTMLANIEDETTRKDVGAMDIPDTRPVFDSFTVDDQNRIWIPLLTENPETNEWWVLAEDGEKLAEFNRPASNRIQMVKNDHVYILETDEETGLQEVVKYSFKMEG